VFSTRIESEARDEELEAAHTDLEVCALEIARLQQSLQQEQARAASLAVDLQAKGISDKLDKAISRSEGPETPFGAKDWDETGGPFLCRALQSGDLELESSDLEVCDGSLCEVARRSGVYKGSGRETWMEARRRERDEWDDEKTALLLQVQKSRGAQSDYY
jgi:hypothetical protein